MSLHKAYSVYRETREPCSPVAPPVSSHCGRWENLTPVHGRYIAPKNTANSRELSSWHPQKQNYLITEDQHLVRLVHTKQIMGYSYCHLETRCHRQSSQPTRLLNRRRM